MLDGWWGEGYNGKNGWAIAPHSPDFDPAFRDAQEATDMLDIIEHEVIPTFYQRDQHGYSRRWVRMSREAMKSCIPRFNSMRMVNDYVQKFYAPARDHCVRLRAHKRQEAAELARWKAKIRAHWNKVHAERLDEARPWLQYGASLPIRVRVFLEGLAPDDVTVECVVGRTDTHGDFHPEAVYPLQHETQEGKSDIFHLDLQPDECGLKTYRLRLYPHHRLLAHPFEMGYLIWIY